MITEFNNMNKFYNNSELILGIIKFNSWGDKN
jgi:hypothetical protein